MRGLYQANYDRMLELGRFPLRLLPGRDVTSAEFDGSMVELHCQSLEQEEQYQARYVVIATGRENAPVPFDDELRQRVEFNEDGELIVETTSRYAGRA